MLAASAHVTTATTLLRGDATSTPAAGADSGGFNDALAALMALLGPPAPIHGGDRDVCGAG